MPELRLTKRSVDAIPFEKSGQILYRDSLLTGFGVRVGKRTKSYFVETQINRRTVQSTIGRTNLLSPEIARKKALSVLATMYDGHNPNVEKRKSSDFARCDRRA